ncbi:diguanylate cyclase [Euryarchaeota archaeon ex4484_178]|nr:MAG: diguanylate cyclase [Euryarchaeota archaeon ex4484_178]
MSEEKEKIYDAIKIGIVILDKELKVVDLNREVIEKAKLDKKIVIGTDFVSWFPGEKRRALKNELIEAWNNESEWRKITLDVEIDKGRVHHLDLRFKRFKDNIIVTIIDRSWLYRTLEKMNIIQSAVDHMAEGLVVTDIDGNILYVNPGFTKITGYSYDEVIGKNPRILKSGKQNKKFYEKMWNTILSGQVWHGELINRRKDGTLYWEEMTIVPVKDEEGKIVNFVAVKHDVTDRKKLEEELKKREEFYRSIFDSSLDGIYIETLDGKLIDVNEAGAKMLGYSREELLKVGLDAIIPEEERGKLPFVQKMLKEKGKVRIEVMNKHKEGYLIPVELSLSLLNIENENLAIAIARDLSYREEQEIKYRTLGEMASDAVVLIDESGLIEYWNPAAEKIFGYREDEVLRKRFWKFIVPDDVLSKYDFEKIPKRLKKLQGSINKRFETVAKRKNGTLVNVELGLSIFRLKKKTYSLAVIRDITERKRLEEKLKRQTEELSSIYRFSIKIGSVLDLKQLSESIYEEARKLINFDSFALGIVDTEKNKVKYEIITQGDKNLGPLEIDIDPKNSLSGWVIINKKPLLIKNFDEEKDKLPAKWVSVGRPIKSWLGIPLVHRGHILGILIVQSFTPNAYGEHEVNFLTTLGAQLSIVLMNAKLYNTLKMSEEKYRGLINSAIVGIVTDDLEGKVTFANEKFAKILGYSVEELLKKSIFDFIAPEEHEKIKTLMRNRQRGKSDYYETVFITKDGRRIDVLVNASPLRDEEGNITGSIGVILDITESKRKQKELKNKNAILEALYNTTLSMGAVPSMRKLFKRVYRELKKIFEFHWFFVGLYDRDKGIIRYDFLMGPEGEIKGYSIEYDPENTLSGWVIKNKKPLVIKDLKKERLPAKYKLINGEKNLERSAIIIPLLYKGEVLGIMSMQHSEPNKYDKNAVKYLTMVATELSILIKNVQLYKETKNAKEGLETLINTSLVGISRVDRQGMINFVNKKFAEILGYEEEELLGKSILELTTEDGRKLLKEKLKRRWRGFSDYYEAQFLRKDGKIIDVLINASPLRDHRGRITGSVGIILDITERKAMERRILEERERYKSLFEAMASIVIIIQDEKIVYVNKVFESATGYSNNEVVGKPFIKFIHPDMREIVLNNYRKRIKGLKVPEHYIIKILAKDGSELWMDLRATLIEWEDEKVVLGSMVDITELKDMEDRLITLDEVSRQLKMARSKEEIYDIAINNIYSVLKVHHAAILELHGEELVMAKCKGYSKEKFRININSRRGITAWVARKNLPYYSPNTAEDPLYIEGVKGAKCEYATPISIDDRIYGVLDVQKDEPYSLSEDDMKIIDLLANNLAVALKSVENQREVEKSKNLQELMLHIVSHDLKNPLAVLSGYVDLLRVEFDPLYLDNMERAIKEASNIIEKARLFSKLGAGKIEEEKVLIDLRSEIEAAAKLLSEKYPNGNIEVKVESTEIYAYPLIREVFVNLIDNALKYGASQVRIVSKDMGDTVEIRVVDNGPGIPKGKRELIFNAFETLSKGKGSGIGLSIVKMIIELHEGKIWVEDNEPKGSIFVIQLPKD